MEKRTPCLLGGLGTFVLLLYVVEVSSAPASQSIVEVMKRDKKLCSAASLVYESNYAKNCSELVYPGNDTTADYIETLFCLAVYDTSYKVCNYSSLWHIPFNTTAAFNSFIEKTFLEGASERKENFCQKIKNVTPIYEKTKALVLLLTPQFNSTYGCLSLCFDSNSKELNPYCAILAWIKAIDDSIDRMHVPKDAKKEPESEGKGIPKESQTNPLPASDSDKPAKEPLVKNEHTEKAKVDSSPPAVQNKVTTDSKKDQSSIEDTKIEASKPAQKKTDVPSEEDKNAQKPRLEDTQPQGDQSNAAISRPPASSTVKDKSPAVETAETLKQDTKNSPVNSGNGISTAQDANQKASNEDTKTSTISENTQDHEDTNNEDELNCNENEKLPYDLSNIPDHSFETGEQNNNKPEPSEQRDIPRYRNLNPEDESHFFTYFTVLSLVFIAAYIGYHNKQKILAIVLEGRRSRNNRSRRRPSTASYRKLDCTLEEAVTSQCNANVTHVIY